MPGALHRFDTLKAVSRLTRPRGVATSSAPEAPRRPERFQDGRRETPCISAMLVCAARVLFFLRVWVRKGGTLRPKALARKPRQNTTVHFAYVFVANCAPRTLSATGISDAFPTILNAVP
jgi:hypothetical protein